MQGDHTSVLSHKIQQPDTVDTHQEIHITLNNSETTVLRCGVLYCVLGHTPGICVCVCRQLFISPIYITYSNRSNFYGICVRN